MKKSVFLFLIFITLFMIACKTDDTSSGVNSNNEKEEKYTISIHYTLNEREDEIITFNTTDVILPELEVKGYIFLGYFDGDEKIEKIELKNYNLETRYKKEVEYHIDIKYSGIEREPDNIIFTASMVNDLALKRLNNDKVFLGFFDGDKEIYKITELKDYNLEAIYVDEKVIELFFKVTEIEYGEYVKYENCKSFFGNMSIISCTLEPQSLGYIENCRRDESFSIYEVNNSQYSFCGDYDYYRCFYLISNRILENNKITGANCNYLSNIRIIPIISDEWKKKGKEEYYKEMMFSLPAGDIVQFDKISLDFDRFEGENIYNIDNDTIIREYTLDRYVLFINHYKLEEYIKDELRKRSINDNYTYFDLYKGIILDVLFEFETYTSDEDRETYELLYSFMYVND